MKILQGKLYYKRFQKDLDYIPLIILSILCIIQVIYAVDVYTNYRNSITLNNVIYQDYDPMISLYSSFTLWVGGSHQTLFSHVYYLFPIASAICVILSKNKVSRDNYISVFLKSGLTILIPLLINFLLILAFVPAITPDSIYDVYFGVFSNSFLGGLYYLQPVIYVFTFLLINFLFWGLTGVITSLIYMLTNNKLISGVTCPLILYMIHIVQFYLNGEVLINGKEISPLNYLNPSHSMFTSWKVIIIELIIVLLVVHFLTILLKLKKRLIHK